MNKTRFAHAEIIGEEIIINFDGRGLPIGLSEEVDPADAPAQAELHRLWDEYQEGENVVLIEDIDQNYILFSHKGEKAIVAGWNDHPAMKVVDLVDDLDYAVWGKLILPVFYLVIEEGLGLDSQPLFNFANEWKQVRQTITDRVRGIIIRR